MNSEFREGRKAFFKYWDKNKGIFGRSGTLNNGETYAKVPKELKLPEVPYDPDSIRYESWLEGWNKGAQEVECVDVER